MENWPPWRSRCASAGGPAQDSGDDDGFEFLEGGVLAIHFGDEETWSEYHPPAKWEQVTSEPDHLAGLNTLYVDEIDEDDEDYDEEFDGDEFELEEPSGPGWERRRRRRMSGTARHRKWRHQRR